MLSRRLHYKRIQTSQAITTLREPLQGTVSFVNAEVLGLLTLKLDSIADITILQVVESDYLFFDCNC